MSIYEDTLSAIRPADREAMARSRTKWDAVGKPLGSLGLLEDDIVRIAGMTGTENFSIRNKCVVVMCADNGVVEEGISQSGQEVTTVVARNLAARRSSVCRMAKVAGAEVYPVDIGIAQPVEQDGIAQCCVRRGTGDFLKEPAMTREEALQAVSVGMETARSLVRNGTDLLATGEMGIGNTTTSAAVLSVLLGRPAAEVTGKGAGLSDAGLERKIRVIESAIEKREPDPEDPLDVLSKLGGLDIAGLTGVCLGGAACHVPVLLDGVVSLASALIAVRLCPDAQEYLLASHCTAEPSGQTALDALGLKPLLYAGMRLGEGTGAVAVMPTLDMAMELYDGDTFADIHMEPYQHL